ncbi:hypothetical protein [Botrimarina hoheduenensis]|uniref:Uncharacterized protein n=1 Tax=Botrimarina hoheduenensis TaxID=2528000 RepID=A0A5C5WAF6_9BACT|nr:hypothetical protein [Botrimarina hoheduenensis]TWT47660.1 hypothetical protein Pla111_12790 [Botrimarina hoheduenensis]
MVQDKAVIVRMIGLLLAAGFTLTARAEMPFLPAPPELALHRERIDLEFDLPATLPCRELATDPATGKRLLEVIAPVSLVLYAGSPDELDDVVIEIDGGVAGLAVHDYEPRTTLTAELTEPIEEKRSVAFDKTLGGSVGAKLGTDVALTPSVSGGFSKTETQSETQSRLPPKTATIVSGTTGGRTGVYFKLRRSSQSTLEGEHTVRVVFAAPADWQAGELQVRCVARGRQDWFFVKRTNVWNESRTPVTLQLVSHTVAKAETNTADLAELAVPTTPEASE